MTFCAKILSARYVFNKTKYEYKGEWKANSRSPQKSQASQAFQLARMARSQLEHGRLPCPGMSGDFCGRLCHALELKDGTQYEGGFQSRCLRTCRRNECWAQWSLCQARSLAAMPPGKLAKACHDTLEPELKL